MRPFFVLLCVFLAVRLAGQEQIGPPQPAQGLERFEGQEVRDILVEPATVGSADQIIRMLRTQVGQPFAIRTLRDDMSVLWSTLRFISSVQAEPLDGGIRLIIELTEKRAYSTFEFKGLDHFSEDRVFEILGIGPRERPNRLVADQYAATLEGRYKRDGYAFARVRIVEDEGEGGDSKLTFWVDEGPKVTIREVFFRGNESIPGRRKSWFWPTFTGSLLGSSGMTSEPEGLLSSSPYSEEVIEEDLESLRFFYRRMGYRDAEVELANRVFLDDFQSVDLTFRVIEGPRYKISGIDLQQVPPRDRDQPLYSKEQVLGEIVTKVGDYYDFMQIERDKRAIQDFYGVRGHPPAQQFGATLDQAFVINDVLEVFDTDAGTIHLTFSLSEGTPKVLNEVLVRGNTRTRDEVVRREVLVEPGQRIDMTMVERSLLRLDSLQYFQDPVDFSGTRFELLPVPSNPDLVDLAVDVQEGSTGSFRWGAGVSTGGGVQGLFLFEKRNADITDVPDSWNPLDIIGDVADNKAFHGAGQRLQLRAAPGSQVSTFSIDFRDPDIFSRYIDRIGFGLNAYRTLRRLDSFDWDSLGVQLSLSRSFGREFSMRLTFRDETANIENLDNNAPLIVFENEGSSELRGLQLSATYANLDFPLRPSEGVRIDTYGDYFGELLGGQETFVKAGIDTRVYFPLYEDSLDRKHVLYVNNRFDWGQGVGDSEDLYPTERFYLGGTTLRGFDQRRAGPVQFGQPVGGEARYIASVEYQFPLVANRDERSLRQVEILRGVVFTDFGLLGLSAGDPTFREPRMSVGFGLRLTVPILGAPIALDLGWPVMSEDTDEQRQFQFSLSRGF